MTEPILTDDEVRAIIDRIDPEQDLSMAKARKLAAALESAWLERLRGEPHLYVYEDLRRSTMDERELFKEAILRLADQPEGSHEMPFGNDTVNSLWAVWQAARRTPAAERAAGEECEWKFDDPENAIWESSCGEAWSFGDGGPIENRMLFCHRCGGKLKISPTSDKGGV